jgi:hypothetical protein
VAAFTAGPVGLHQKIAPADTGAEVCRTAWGKGTPRRAVILARRWHGRDGERAAEAAPIVAAHAGRAAAGKATPLVILRACAQLAVARQSTQGRK